jgi:hypothetical protein
VHSCTQSHPSDCFDQIQLTTNYSSNSCGLQTPIMCTQPATDDAVLVELPITSNSQEWRLSQFFVRKPPVRSPQLSCRWQFYQIGEARRVTAEASGVSLASGSITVSRIRLAGGLRCSGHRGRAGILGTSRESPSSHSPNSGCRVRRSGA